MPKKGKTTKKEKKKKPKANSSSSFRASVLLLTVRKNGLIHTRHVEMGEEWGELTRNRGKSAVRKGNYAFSEGQELPHSRSSILKSLGEVQLKKDQSWMTHKGLRRKQLLQFVFFSILVILKDCCFPEEIPENWVSLRPNKINLEDFQLKILYLKAAIAENHLNISQPRRPPSEKDLVGL